MPTRGKSGIAKSDEQVRGEKRAKEASDTLELLKNKVDLMQEKDADFVRSCLANRDQYGIHWRVSERMLEWLLDIEDRLR